MLGELDPALQLEGGTAEAIDRLGAARDPERASSDRDPAVGLRAPQSEHRQARSQVDLSGHGIDPQQRRAVAIGQPGPACADGDAPACTPTGIERTSAPFRGSISDMTPLSPIVQT